MSADATTIKNKTEDRSVLHEKTLTRQQQKGLHVWFQKKAEQCRKAGVTTQLALSKTIDLDMSPEMMKEIFRCVMIARHHKKSTTELAKHNEIDELIEHLNRFFAEKFNLAGIKMPSHEEGYWESAPLLEDKPTYV